MFLIKTVSPEEATGKVAAIYESVPKEIGIPKPMLLLSASPALLERQAALIDYYMNHKRLTFPLGAAIRFVAAQKSGHPYCIEFNGEMLCKMGMTKEELAELTGDPGHANLEPDEAAMLAFVSKAMDDPGSVTKADIEALRAHGYADTDIFDALAHGANMFAGAVLYKTFVRED